MKKDNFLMANRYYIKKLETKFQFGKHKGDMFFDVLLDDPTYIYWCSENIPKFEIHSNVIKTIMEMDPSILLPITLLDSINDWGDGEEDDEEDYYDEPYVNISYQDDPTYDRYNGSYAQDEMGYSDDDIDTIFDGDPDAYWNID